jgi:nicotinamidase-related amidase
LARLVSDALLGQGKNLAIDSYSGFADVQYLAFTQMSYFLHHADIEEVEIVGLATDYCVRYTAVDASKFGFATKVIKAGVRAVEPEKEGEIFDEFSKIWGIAVE